MPDRTIGGHRRGDNAGRRLNKLFTLQTPLQPACVASTQFMRAMWAPSWHRNLPSPAELASVPYSTEPPTGTTCKKKDKGGYFLCPTMPTGGCHLHHHPWLLPSAQPSSNSEVNLLLNLRSAVHKFMIPEFESRIFDQLNKGDEKTPRMWSVHNQSLQQDPICQEKKKKSS